MISLAFLLLSKKKHLYCKLQLFSQNTDVLDFSEDFCMYQRIIDEYNNSQIPNEFNNENTNRSGVSIVNFEQISHLVLFFLPLAQLYILRYFSCVGYIAGTGGGSGGAIIQ